MSEYVKCSLLRRTAAYAIIFRNDVNFWERGSVVIKVTRYLTDTSIVDSYSQHEWINKESVLPRIEIPVSDHHHSLFQASKALSVFKSVQKKEKKVVDLC